MENYYDILEVSEKASDEVIEKAYKVLVKRYHPDLQQPQNKSKAEEMMKKINEAYDVLSNSEKRAEYDAKLNEQKQKEYKERYYNNQNYSEEENYQGEQEYNQNGASRVNYQDEQLREQGINKQQYQQNEYYEEEYRRRLQEQLNREAYERQIRNQRYEQQYRNQMQNEINKQYENAYYNYLRSLGYKIKEKWTWKKTVVLIEVIGILALAITALWFFPPTNKLLVAFYEGNPIIKWIIDVIVKLVQAIWTSICKLFTNPPQI